jgi:hypothetical protein
MYSKPLKLLNGKLSSVKTSAGEPLKVELGYFPTGGYQIVKGQTLFWKKAMEETGFPNLDLSPLMTAFKTTFEPISEREAYHHMTVDGHTFTSLLLAHELISRKIIPFEPDKKSVK